MYTSFQLAKKYLHYYRTAFNSKGHGMHSPFVFELIQDVLNNRQGYKPPAEIEILRTHLLRNKQILSIEDLGAGSRSGATSYRTVGQLAATAAKPKKWGRLLYRLVQKYKPQTILELGTSLGISTAYMAKANEAAAVYTIEGSKAIHDAAVENLKALQLQNIQPVYGPFDDALPPLLRQLNSVDLAYIDGNHRYEPTLRYFEALLQKKTESSIFIFDDIHWSAEMEQAWKEIKAQPEVRCTVDIFFMGAVFFRPGFRQKQDFAIRF